MNKDYKFNCTATACTPLSQRLQHCGELHLQTDLTGIKMHAFAKTALDVCPYRRDIIPEEYHIYTDGSWSDNEHRHWRATWGFCVVAENSAGEFGLVGAPGLEAKHALL